MAVQAFVPFPEEQRKQVPGDTWVPLMEPLAYITSWERAAPAGTPAWQAGHGCVEAHSSVRQQGPALFKTSWEYICS